MNVKQVMEDGVHRIRKWGFTPTYRFYKYVRYKNNYLQNRKKELDFPRQVMIEVTNRCNIKCVMCPREIMTRPVGDMDYGLFKKIANEIEGTPMGYMVMHYSGEPLLNKKIIDMIQYAKKKKIGFIKFNTNGTLVNRSCSEQLINSGLDQVVFAVESSRKNHDRFRVGSDYDKVKSNIIQLMDLKTLKQRKKPIVTVQMLKSSTIDDEDLSDAYDFWKTRVDSVNIRSITTVGGQVENFGMVRDVMGECRMVYTTMGILWNGDVVPCCVDHDGKLVMGNVRDQSLKEIWNSDHYKEFREKHRKKNYDGMDFCKRCLRDL